MDKWIHSYWLFCTTEYFIFAVLSTKQFSRLCLNNVKYHINLYFGKIMGCSWITSYNKASKGNQPVWRKEELLVKRLYFRKIMDCSWITFYNKASKGNQPIWRKEELLVKRSPSRICNPQHNEHQHLFSTLYSYISQIRTTTTPDNKEVKILSSLL
jgi:hypothetical protein